mmetsp:Transcript_89103/g.250875  ORF Transcript_89103/g.250875 Transcript_89103/m.250875 type:complete len:253 (+) Transcript_89103:220-978(+)
MSSCGSRRKFLEPCDCTIEVPPAGARPGGLNALPLLPTSPALCAGGVVHWRRSGAAGCAVALDATSGVVHCRRSGGAAAVPCPPAPPEAACAEVFGAGAMAAVGRPARPAASASPLDLGATSSGGATWAAASPCKFSSKSLARSCTSCQAWAALTSKLLMDLSFNTKPSYSPFTITSFAPLHIASKPLWHFRASPIWKSAPSTSCWAKDVSAMYTRAVPFTDRGSATVPQRCCKALLKHWVASCWSPIKSLQ